MTVRDVAVAHPEQKAAAAERDIPMVPILSVVVPTFNESANVTPLIERLSAALHTVAWEVIFVDDNSPDGTAGVVREHGARDPRVRCIRRIGRRGLAGACIEGMLASQARYVAVMDADLQHDESLLADMLALLQRGEADLVVGSRGYEDRDIDMLALLPRGETSITPNGDGAANANTEKEALSAERMAGSQLANRLARKVLGVELADPMSGFFMLERATFESIAPRLSTQGFKILADILASTPRELRVRELRFTFRPRLHGESKLDSRVVMDFVGLMIAKATRDAVPVRFLGFLLVGALGMLIHLATLKFALTGLAMEFATAQTVATFVSMTSNFFFNNALNYRDQRLSGLDAVRGLLLFYVICAVGAVSNIGVATWLYSNQPIWWVAGLLGSIVGATWNYALSSFYVWRGR